MIFWKKRLRLALPLVLASCSAMTDRPTGSTPILTPPSTAAQTRISATDALCASLSIVQLSRQDTTGTKAQVEANNAVLTKVCASK